MCAGFSIRGSVPWFTLVPRSKSSIASQWHLLLACHWQSGAALQWLMENARLQGSHSKIVSSGVELQTACRYFMVEISLEWYSYYLYCCNLNIIRFQWVYRACCARNPVFLLLSSWQQSRFSSVL